MILIFIDSAKKINWNQLVAIFSALAHACGQTMWLNDYVVRTLSIYDGFGERQCHTSNGRTWNQFFWRKPCVVIWRRNKYWHKWRCHLLIIITTVCVTHVSNEMRHACVHTPTKKINPNDYLFGTRNTMSALPKARTVAVASIPIRAISVLAHWIEPIPDTRCTIPWCHHYRLYSRLVYLFRSTEKNVLHLFFIFHFVVDKTASKQANEWII